MTDEDDKKNKGEMIKSTQNEIKDKDKDKEENVVTLKSNLKVVESSKNKTSNGSEKNNKDGKKDKHGNTWIVLKHYQNKENGEEKFLLKIIGKVVYFKDPQEFEQKNCFKVVWLWRNCKPDIKIMYSLRKAHRLYETIDLSGWEEVA